MNPPAKLIDWIEALELDFASSQALVKGQEERA